MRSHGAGTLRAEHTGTTVTLAGWVARRRDHGGVAFVDLRDASGVVQVVVRDEMLAASGAHDLRNEYCVQVRGEVARRPEGNANPDLPTGEIEVVTAELTVLTRPPRCRSPSTSGSTWGGGAAEVPLPRPAPSRARPAAIRLRSEVNRVARNLLGERGFVEVETPTMTRSTPEGARDFLVRRGSGRARGTRCRRARSCSSSCSWWPGWSATSRSPAATATRTSGPTGSRSSPSSTSR
jgi:aspartyl-tRNA synthetase